MSNKVISNVFDKTTIGSSLPVDIRGDLTKNYSVVSSTSHLILSSSVGSIVYISGTLVSGGPISGTFSGTLSGTFSGSVDISGGKLIGVIVSGTFSGSVDISSGPINNSLGHLIVSSSVGSVFAVSSSLDFPNSDKNYHVRAVNSHLILSSSIGSVIALSASEDYANTDKPWHIRAINSHLIFSSSAGSVIRMSGAIGTLDLTTATLPANDVILTGSIVWDSTTKTIKIYGPEGWCPVLTGSAG